MYIWLAITAYFLFALNGIADKFLLTRVVKHPSAYAFYIGITGPLTWLLAPFGLKFISVTDFLIAVAGGAAFVAALYFLYAATRMTSISRILPIEGGLVPVFTLVLAYLVLGERLAANQIMAFIFLVSGAVLISLKKERTGWKAEAFGRAVIAAVLFALSFTLTKYIFGETNFISGLIWTRVGFSLASLSFLIPRASRRYIFAAPRKASTGNKLLYYGVRLSGGAAGLLQNYAIAIGSVTIVNALQGTQYATLLALTLWLSKYYPKILSEKTSAKILGQKLGAVALISAGLFFLAR